MPINIPPGEGWWLKARTGEAVKIAEHWEAVKADPRKYGVAELPKRTLMEDRAAALTEVLKKGWIRVRTHRAEVRFKAWLLVAQSSRDLFRTWTVFEIGMGMAKSAALDLAIRQGEDIDNLIVQGPPRTTGERATLRAVRAAAIRNGYRPE